MTERERLVEMLNEWGNKENDGVRAESIADYLIANGVILPPCKVGNTIYQTDGVRIYASTIHEITYTASKVIFVTENTVFDEQAINNSIFFTPEEAEKALERSNNNA
jgi:hypothetical protein